MRENTFKASIIVLTYQNFDNLRNNIESILKQTYSNYEVIISDDGSQSFDRDYIESLYKENDYRDKFSIITREHNVGTVRNFNAAVKASAGDIIIPLSQDDRFYNENVLSDIIDAFSSPAVNICLGLRVIEGTDHILPNRTQIKIMQGASQKKLWFRNACNNLYYGSALYYRKDYLQNAGLFDESYRLLEDYPFVMNCIEREEKIHIINAPTIFYSANGVSSGKKKTKISQIMNNDFFQMYERNYLHSIERINSSVCRKYLLNRMRSKDEHSSRLSRYSNIILDAILVLTKIEAAHTKEQISDCRFSMLWKLEKLVTKIKGN